MNNVMLNISSININIWITCLLPIVTGGVFLVFPKCWEKMFKLITFLTIVFVFICQILIFIKRPFLGCNFNIDNLNGFVLIFLGLFSLITAVYSLKYFSSKLSVFYAYVLFALGVSNFTVLTNNMLFLLIGWGILGIVLYLLINYASPESASASKKTFIIVGGADAFLIIGIAILWSLTKSFNFNEISSSLSGLGHYSGLINISFICFIVAAIAKAGAFPLHTWIPEISPTTSIPTLAFMPASLDKLLGIYLLARCMIDIFKISPMSGFSLALVFLGGFTVIAAVMMALVQHNMRKLLSYHAVSQVGYMLIGLGSMHPIGILGGLFHMLNNTIYKTCLFLSAGNVEKRTNTTDLDKLGGLARFMPLTFTAMLIASLSISGVPPFNGFYSKWMVYQGVIIRLTDTSFSFFARGVYGVALIFALLGSALTLASFLKVMFGVFLGQRSKLTSGVKEADKTMVIPVVFLALLCIVFGLFGESFVLKYLINPISVNLEYGLWLPQVVMILMLFAGTLGVIAFALSRSKIRIVDNFIGGEVLSDEVRPRATEFYISIRENGVLGSIYNMAEKKIFDIYEVCLKIVFGIIRVLRYLHNGILPTYLVWCLIGVLILFFKIIK
ncbi:MAG: proton-conducting transporter membrane subunit [Candidatus Saelkia tenebricola]|nr:proton-conducting transporter membrane subunit [Candidatus Saelkia tenebricola]